MTFTPPKNLENSYIFDELKKIPAVTFRDFKEFKTHLFFIQRQNMSLINITISVEYCVLHVFPPLKNHAASKEQHVY